MAKTCLVIGDLNTDLILSGLNKEPQLGGEILSDDYVIDIGGSGGIFAAVLSNLGLNTHIISKIGRDYLGDLLIHKLKDSRVNLDRIVQDNSNTGLTVNLSYLEDKYQISSLQLVSSLKMEEICFRKIPQLAHVHFSSYYMMKSLKPYYPQLITSIKKNYPGRITFSMDTNDDPSSNWGEDIYHALKYIDILFVNKKEALSITKKTTIAEALEKLNPAVSLVVIKLAGRGYLAQQGQLHYQGDAVPAIFKDSTGAGDNFDAGFILGYLNGFDTKQCLDMGNICGAKSVEYLGGVGAKEKFGEIKKLFQSL
ncbi:MAG: PfkB family carbohydrate kinase [Actinomycetota bacterium]|nr:PfkB family carbohydrate kinase [Actinomycetota bacterium]